MKVACAELFTQRVNSGTQVVLNKLALVLSSVVTRADPQEERGYGRNSTITFPAIVWCEIPQYSWQTRRYSPGRSKRAVTRAT